MNKLWRLERGRLFSGLAFCFLGCIFCVSCFCGDTIRELVDARGFAEPFATQLHTAAVWLAGMAVAAAALGCALLLAVPGFRKPHRAFLLFAVLIGPLYVFSLTPFSPPDERFHWCQTLRFASELTGRRNLDSSFGMNMFHGHVNRPDGYVRMLKTFEKSKSKPRPIDLEVEYGRFCWEKHGTWSMYVSQIAGVSLGLKAGAPALAVFYLGRLFTLGFYIIAVFFAIRMAPMFKGAICVAASCPITLQQVCSYSYDAESLMMSFFCFALFLKCVCATDAKIGRAEKLALLATVAVGMTVKCAAFPFLPLLLLLPSFRFRRGRFEKIRFLALLGIIACAAASTCASVTPNALRGKSFGELAYKDAARSMSVETTPLKLLRVLLDTFDQFFQIHFFDSFGCRLSGLSMHLPFHIMLLFVAAFFVVAHRDGKSSTCRSVCGLRLAAASGWILLTGSLFFIMLTTWTPEASRVILGLQGRYWTPVLPLVAACLFTRHSGNDTSIRPIVEGSCTQEEASATSGARRTHIDRLLFPAMLLANCDAIVFIVKETLKNTTIP